MDTVRSSLLILLLSTISFSSNAEWVRNVNVTMIGTYQFNPGHFVWLSQNPVNDCVQANPSNPTLYFSEASAGGKSLLSVLIAAAMAKSNLDVQVNGCDIVEVYLKSN